MHTGGGEDETSACILDAAATDEEILHLGFYFFWMKHYISVGQWVAVGLGRANTDIFVPPKLPRLLARFTPTSHHMLYFKYMLNRVFFILFLS